MKIRKCPNSKPVNKYSRDTYQSKNFALFSTLFRKIRSISTASYQMLPLKIALRYDDSEYHDYQQVVAIFLAKIPGASQVQVGRQLSSFLKKVILFILLPISNRFVHILRFTAELILKVTAERRQHMIIIYSLIMLHTSGTIYHNRSYKTGLVIC